MDAISSNPPPVPVWRFVDEGGERTVGYSLSSFRSYWRVFAGRRVGWHRMQERAKSALANAFKECTK